jgi:hypothetical protein
VALKIRPKTGYYLAPNFVVTCRAGPPGQGCEEMGTRQEDSEALENLRLGIMETKIQPTTRRRAITVKIKSQQPQIE